MPWKKSFEIKTRFIESWLLDKMENIYLLHQHYLILHINSDVNSVQDYKEKEHKKRRDVFDSKEVLLAY